MMRYFLATVVGSAILAAPAAAAPGPGEIGYPRGALGYDALVSADLATAEAQLRARNGVTKNDPARLINLGYVLARTGRTDRAARMFERVIREDEVELILANGERISSHEAAERALAALRSTRISSR